MFHSKTLELSAILERLAAYAVSQRGKEALLALTPVYDLAQIQRRLQELDEARSIINQQGSLPINPMLQLERALEQLSKEPVLTAQLLESMALFLEDVSRLKFTLERSTDQSPTVSAYGASFSPLQDLKESIRLAISNGEIQDQASSALQKIRKRISITEDQIKDKLYALLKSHGPYLMDALIVQRGGRYALPVKAEHKKMLDGDLLDKSASGQTLYLEPRSVQILTHNLHMLKIDEEQECLRILSELTNLCATHEKAIKLNQETMLHCDLLFAKARLSRQMNGRSAHINQAGYVKLINAIHPLLDGKAVPLNIELGSRYKGILITGPNTGGKTVAMKTVGLLALMNQCGLHIPCEAGSTLPLFQHILADIGDGQSISQNLSTFSSHIEQINKVLNYANINSLVLLDEIGAGTEPSEGSGLAKAILEHLSTIGCLILSSTHFTELKIFAEEHPAFINASMCFDQKTLQPLYRMEQGKAGKSHALHIAYRLGMSLEIVGRAHQITYGEAFEHDYYPAESTEATIHPTITQNKVASPVTKAIHKDIYRKNTFALGDSVWLKSLGKSGTVLTDINQRGEYQVMINGVKCIVNHKRLTPYIESKELYPDDYDMRVVTHSVYDRKKDKLISKGKHKKLENLKKKE